MDMWVYSTMHTIGSCLLQFMDIMIDTACGVRHVLQLEMKIGIVRSLQQPAHYLASFQALINRGS